MKLKRIKQYLIVPRDWKNTDFKKLSKFVPILGLFLFIYIIYSIGVEKIANTFVLIPIHIYVLASLPTILRVFIYGYKWEYISKKQKINIDFLFYLKITLVCMFYSLITPGGLGWHIRIFYLMKKAKLSIEKCTTNSLLDSVTGSLMGLSYAFIGSIVLFDNIPGLLPIFSILLILNILGFAMLLKKEEVVSFLIY